MHLFRVAGAALLTSVLAAPAMAGVTFSLVDGRVTLVATDATVKQILDEWSRVGGTAFVNAERIAGGPISMELHDVPERTALDIVLRAAAGYVASPRAVVAPTQSAFERVLVLSTSAASPAVRGGANVPPAAPANEFQASDDIEPPAIDAVDVPPGGAVQARRGVRGGDPDAIPFRLNMPVPGPAPVVPDAAPSSLASEPTAGVVSPLTGQAGTITAVPPTQSVIFHSPSESLGVDGQANPTGADSNPR